MQAFPQMAPVAAIHSHRNSPHSEVLLRCAGAARSTGTHGVLTRMPETLVSLDVLLPTIATLAR